VSETPCLVLKKLVEERAPWLTVTQEERELIREQEKFWYRCVVYFKDPDIMKLFEDYALKLVGGVEFDREGKVLGSDIPMGVVVKGEEPEMPTNIVRFPEKCQLREMHLFDHKSPNIHLHLECDILDKRGLTELADAIARITRRTREYAGLK